MPARIEQEDRSNPVVSKEDADGVDAELEELAQELAHARTLQRRLKRELRTLESDFERLQEVEPAFETIATTYKRRKVEAMLTKVTTSATELLKIGREMDGGANRGT